MEAPRPAVGQNVHYVSFGTPPREDGSQAYTSKCRAAIITARCSEDLGPEEGEPGPCVDLAVLNPTGMFFNEHVAHDQGCPFEVGDTRQALCNGLAYEGGTWHWPAYA